MAVGVPDRVEYLGVKADAGRIRTYLTLRWNSSLPTQPPKGLCHHLLRAAVQPVSNCVMADGEADMRCFSHLSVNNTALVFYCPIQLELPKQVRRCLGYFPFLFQHFLRSF